MAVIDPGPDVENHVRALASELAAADEVFVVLTHGHADHAGAAQRLAEAVGGEVWGPEGIDVVDRVLSHGDVVDTDEGALVAVHTPGHTVEHLCFHWRERSAVFAGDLVLGEGDTTWVAEYPGCVADYLESLEVVRRLEVSVIYPAHGAPLVDPIDVLNRFAEHRTERIEQVREAMSSHPDVGLDQLLDIVYGDRVSGRIRAPARMSLSALMDYVRTAEG